MIRKGYDKRLATGLVLLAMKSVTPSEISMSDIMWGVTPVCFVLAASLVPMMILLAVSTWLPSLAVSQRTRSARRLNRVFSSTPT
jgi:hypothetical protein